MNSNPTTPSDAALTIMVTKSALDGGGDIPKDSSLPLELNHNMLSINDTRPVRRCLPIRQGREATAAFDVGDTIPCHRSLHPTRIGARRQRCHPNIAISKLLLATTISFSIDSEPLAKCGGIYLPHSHVSAFYPNNFQPQDTSSINR